MNRKFRSCFITGVTGSAGSYLAEYIIKKDKKIKIYGSYRSKGYLNYLRKKYKKIKLYKIDLNNFLRLKKILNKTKPDVIFHFASKADVRKSFSYPIKFIQNNNLITINLLESARQLKLKSLIVVCGTSEVYGNVSKKDTPIKENQIMKPASPYAASKAFQDLISQVYFNSFNLNIIITRMFSYTNSRRTNLFQSSFANQIVKIEKGKLKQLKHGNLNSIRTVVDSEDAMSAYWLVAKKGRIGEIYNIGGDKTISVRQYLNELIKLSNKKIKTKKDKKLFRPQDVTLQIPNVNKFKKHTEWSPKIKFKESLKKLLEDFRSRA